MREELQKFILNEMYVFENLNFQHSIVQNSIPILWFGDVDRYFRSKIKVLTVSLNPSDKEFRFENDQNYSPEYRFPLYDGSVNSLYSAYNAYFGANAYSAWFNPSFGAVLESFNASYYNGQNIAVHTDIGSPYATSPTWSKLSIMNKNALEPIGADSWHNLMRILKPEVILYSASPGFENKIAFDPVDDQWTKIDVEAKRPLLRRRFHISEDHQATVLFQVQGRKPFLQTSAKQKLLFSKHLNK